MTLQKSWNNRKSRSRNAPVLLFGITNQDVTVTAWTGTYEVSFPSVHQGFLTYRIDSDRLFL